MAGWNGRKRSIVTRLAVLFTHSFRRTGSGELERVHDWTGACIEFLLPFSFLLSSAFFIFIFIFLSVEFLRIGEWWMKGWESDDEMMDGSLVFMNVTAWRYVVMMRYDMGDGLFSAITFSLHARSSSSAVKNTYRDTCKYRTVNKKR
jgi:hypothetical protein